MDFEPTLNLISKTNELIDQCKKHIILRKVIERQKKLDQCIQDHKKLNKAVFYSRRDLEKQYQIWKNEMIMKYGKDRQGYRQSGYQPASRNWDNESGLGNHSNSD